MKKTNPILDAINAVNAHIAFALKGARTIEDIKADLNKLSKSELIEMLAVQMKTEKVTIESVCKPILADPKCAWLTSEQVADLIKKQIPEASTSGKSIASYRSKYPKEKNWTVVPLIPRHEVHAELMKLTAEA